jgi:anti-anti-sigma factor
VLQEEYKALQEEFWITTERLDGCLVVTVRGELDELNASPLDQTLTARTDSAPVIVDLSRVSFICSTSIRVLVKDRPQGRPALVAPAGSVRKVLDIVNADRTNPIFYDRDSALQSLTLQYRLAG